MPTTTRSGKVYDLTATASAAQRQRRRRGRGRDVERMLDAQRRRTARARLPDERRAAVREMNTSRTREARARMTDERRAAVREVHTSRMRESRAQRQLVASPRHMWCELPVHRTPNPPVLQSTAEQCC